MKFKIEKSDLVKNLMELNKIIPVRHSMPILSNFLIDANQEENIVKVTASDMQRTVVVRFPANIVEGGKVVVSAQKLSAIVNAFDETTILFERVEDYFKISCKKSNFKLLCAEIEQYPILPRIDFSETAIYPADSIKKMIELSSFATSKGTKRKAFNGVYWKISEDKQIMAATDGKRVAEVTYENNDTVGENLEKIMPIETLNFLTQIIDETDNEIKILFYGNRIAFKYKNYIFLSNYIEAKYPDYKTVIPYETNKKELIINREKLSSSIKKVSLLASEETQKIKFEINSNTIEISAVNHETGEAKDSVPVVEYNGDPLSISFNYRFFVEILKKLSTDNVRIMLNKKQNPIIFYNIFDKDNDYKIVYILMPLRTR